MYSIRRRLLLVLMIGFALLLTGSGVALSAAMRGHVTAEFDAALLVEARAFVALTEQEGGQVELEYDAAAMPQFERVEKPAYFQLWRDDGRMLLRSRHLEVDLPRPAALPLEGAARDVTLPDGRSGRMMALAFEPRVSLEDEDEGTAAGGTADEAALAVPLGHKVLVLVAKDRGRLDSLLARMVWTIVLLGALALAGALLLVWRALVAGLRPIDAIAAQVSALDAESLDTRVEIDPVPEELGPVVAQVNGLMDRLEEAFQRERRFTGNVAHELRTPIAELRSLAAVGARWPDDHEAVSGYFQDVGDVAGRMDGMIADLLLLARCQAGVEALARTRVTIAAAIEAVWAGHQSAAKTRDVRLRVDVPLDLAIESDERKLGILLSNLLGNAVSYAQPGSEITCLAKRDGERFEIHITNVAEPLRPDDLKRLAEPFWRKDAARAPSDHAGLGLALVAALGDLLSLETSFSQDGAGLFRAQIVGALVPLALPNQARTLVP